MKGNNDVHLESTVTNSGPGQACAQQLPTTLHSRASTPRPASTWPPRPVPAPGLNGQFQGYEAPGGKKSAEAMVTFVIVVRAILVVGGGASRQPSLNGRRLQSPDGTESIDSAFVEELSRVAGGRRVFSRSQRCDDLAKRLGC